jgi:hypothetical protein
LGLSERFTVIAFSLQGESSYLLRCVDDEDEGGPVLANVGGRHSKPAATEEEDAARGGEDAATQEADAATEEADQLGDSTQPWYRTRWASVAGVLLIAVAVVIVIAVAAGTYRTSSSRGGGSDAMSEWSSKSGPAVGSTGTAIQALSDAMQAHDLAGLMTGCQQLQDASVQLRATLPSPDPALTAAVEAAVADLETASNSCMAFGPNTTKADLEQFMSQVDRAKSHMDRATQIVLGAEKIK